VAQAEDGEVALEWLAMNEVDVVITDINMPRLDGFGLIERRQGSRHRDRPILVLTTEERARKRAARVRPAPPAGSSSLSIRKSWSPRCAASPTDRLSGDIPCNAN
jgi:two-component system chemotaxis response regulator CheY